MPTVVNDLILEPTAPAPEEAGIAGATSQGNAPAGPALERQLQRLERRRRERSLRLWAH